jgi:YYY domain-containing protein
MILDWLQREGGAVFSWWLLSFLAGLAVFPLFFRLMHALPSRGYALARAGGIMLIGFVFWILNIFGLLQNTAGSTVFAAVIVIGIGIVSYVTWRERDSLREWLRANWSHILAAEILFAVMFVGWTVVRSLNNEIWSTEKPMDMAFLSASRRSATFPPHDPWMSGYAISYYHFGYILMAMIANMTGGTNGMALNLAVSLIFATTGVGAFGIGYDLVVAHLQRPHRKRKHHDDDSPDQPTPRHYPQAIAVGVLAAVFVVVMGNLGTAMIEIPYQTCAASPAYLQFMDIPERDSYPQPVQNGDCGTTKSADSAGWNWWWWFRYSRVIRDIDIDGQPIGAAPISEFPNFSFILSDMHPHVLALPFATLVLGLSLNLILRKRKLAVWEIFIYAIFGGGMIFLNSWDAAYLVIIIAAEALRRLIANGTGKFTSADWRGIAIFAVLLGGFSLLLYSPFFISFRSQAEGFAPNILWPTRFQQLFVMFGIFIVIIAGYLIIEIRRAGRSFNPRFAMSTIGTLVAFLVVALLFMVVVGWSNDQIRNAVFQYTGTNDIRVLLTEMLPKVLSIRGNPLVLLSEGTLIAMLFIVVARLFVREPVTETGEPEPTHQVITYSPSTGFTLLIIAAGATLILLPDFTYLRDNFGVRMNTVFKLYYQGWLIWSIASAYALWSVLFDREPAVDGTQAQSLSTFRMAYGLIAVLLIFAGLLYPFYAIKSRALQEAGQLRGNEDVHAMTLDGGVSLAAGADDYKVIQCLEAKVQNDSDVVLEGHKPDAAYAHEYGRVSALSGIPTLLGWRNHEQQWRGKTYAEAAGSRAEDTSKLYNTSNWSDVLDIIEKYSISYIYVGPTERRLYTSSGLSKFDGLTPVCKYGDVAVYSADSIGLQAAPAGN